MLWCHRTSRCAAGRRGVKKWYAASGPSAPAKVRGLPVLALQCALAAVVQSHSESFQLLITPLSPQTGHAQRMSFVSGSKSVVTIPGQGLRPGRRRHFTVVLLGRSKWSVLASTTSLPKNSARRLAGPGIGAIAPFPERKCVRSVIHVLAIALNREELRLLNRRGVCLQHPNVRADRRAALLRASGSSARLDPA